MNNSSTVGFKSRAFTGGVTASTAECFWSDVSALNSEFFDLLIFEHAVGVRSLPGNLSAQLSGSTFEQRARMARCIYVLFEVTTVARGAELHVPPSSPIAERRADLARALRFFVWHWGSRQPLATRLAVASERECAAKSIIEVGKVNSSLTVEPRWLRHHRFWGDLLMSVHNCDSDLNIAHALGLQLAAASWGSDSAAEDVMPITTERQGAGQIRHVA